MHKAALMNADADRGKVATAKKMARTSSRMAWCECEGGRASIPHPDTTHIASSPASEASVLYLRAPQSGDA